MADREDVIQALEKCIKQDTCDQCRYYGICGEEEDAMMPLLKDALFLLKEQETRVMTQKEAIGDYTGVVYYESIYSSIVLAGYVDSIRNGRCEIATIGSEETEKEMLSDYGIKWRCWTSCPTDEQRKATPWAEPPKEE